MGDMMVDILGDIKLVAAHRSGIGQADIVDEEEVEPILFADESQAETIGEIVEENHAQIVVDSEGAPIVEEAVVEPGQMLGAKKQRIGFFRGFIAEIQFEGAWEKRGGFIGVDLDTVASDLIDLALGIDLEEKATHRDAGERGF